LYLNSNVKVSKPIFSYTALKILILSLSIYNLHYNPPAGNNKYISVSIHT